MKKPLLIVALTAFFGLPASADQWRDIQQRMSVARELFREIKSDLPACRGEYFNSDTLKYNWRNCIGWEEGVESAFGGEFGSRGFMDGQVVVFSANTIFKGVLRLRENSDGRERLFYAGRGEILFGNGDSFKGELFGEHWEGAKPGVNMPTWCQEEINFRRQECNPDTNLLFWSGDGTYTWRDGSKHEGRFVDTLADGLGARFAPDGRLVSRGTWRNGALVSVVGPTPSPPPVRPVIVSPPEVQPTPPNVIPPSATLGNRVALVIGNSSYANDPLPNAVNDSTDIAAMLRSRGFKVIEKRDVSLKQMREAARQFATEMEKSDAALVFYSGHGIEVGGRNFLIPVDEDIKRDFEVANQAFDLGQFVDMMERVPSTRKNRVNILIVDACRDNKVARSWRSVTRGLVKIDAPRGTFVAFSTAPGSVASDGTGRNSPFTKHLLRAIQQPNQPIELVFKNVRRAVIEETKGDQVPWENSSLIGDFYFTLKP